MFFRVLETQEEWNYNVVTPVQMLFYEDKSEERRTRNYPLVTIALYPTHGIYSSVLAYDPN